MDFTAEFFNGNRRKLLEHIDAQLVVITASGLLQRSADTTFPFRQDSYFWYLTGINEPDFILVFSAETSFLIAPKRAEHRDTWDGALDETAMKHHSGIDEIIEHHAGWTKLDLLLKKHKKAATADSPETYFDLFGFYTNPARSTLLKELKRHRNLEIVDVKKPLAKLRQVKQAPEIAALQKAIDITAQALQVVRAQLQTYKFEHEVVADITGAFIRHGAKGHAYEPIVASGVNAATIHHLDCTSPITNNALLLLDVGAEVSNYSADISRTYAIGHPTSRMEDVYAAVSRVRQAAFKLLKPGVLPRQYEAQVDAIMAQELHGLGLLNNTEDKKKFRALYPHLTSHFLGLDTHDAADYERPLEPGMVLTVEPGIYLPAESIGVRIEDDVLITTNGIEILSDNIPATLM